MLRNPHPSHLPQSTTDCREFRIENVHILACQTARLGFPNSPSTLAGFLGPRVITMHRGLLIPV
jgi:hypothetical protein